MSDDQDGPEKGDGFGYIVVGAAVCFFAIFLLLVIGWSR